MKGYFIALLAASICSAICVSLAGEGYEKYIKYVCALVCAVMLVSPLCGLDISAVLPGASLPFMKTGHRNIYPKRFIPNTE